MSIKFGIRFFLSWIFTSATMFALFYVWHGLFLNDFKRIQFPLTWFVGFAAVTYLLVGAGLYLLFESSLMRRISNFLSRGIFCGVIAGFSLFMIATVVNISLTSHLSKEHLLIDCVWQITEQTAGGLVVALLKVIIHEQQHESI